MEETKNEIEEEQNDRWITILLIIGNLIIWSMIILFVSIAKVNALAVNPNSNQIYAESLNGTNPEYITIGQNQEYTLPITKKSNLFVSNFINLGTGVYKGTAYIKYYNLQGETCAQIKNATNRVVLSLNDIEVVGTKQIPACSISDNYVTIKIDYSYTNMQTNGTFKLIYRLPSWNSGFKYLMNSTLDYEQKDYATNTDIENQTISIINNAIQNALDQVQQSIQNRILIENAINTATSQIQNAINNQNLMCEEINETETTMETKVFNTYLDINGNGIVNQNYGITDYIKLNSNRSYTVTLTDWPNENSAAFCWYNENKTLINCQNEIQTISPYTLTGASYVRFSKRSPRGIHLTGQYCQDRTEALLEEFDLIYSFTFNHVTPDKTQFEITHAMEDDILDMADDIDLDRVQIDIDTDTSNWVWNTLTSFIQANAIVGSMFISILSIGIIKLLFNR